MDDGKLTVYLHEIDHMLAESTKQKKIYYEKYSPSKLKSEEKKEINLKKANLRKSLVQKSENNSLILFTS